MNIWNSFLAMPHSHVIVSFHCFFEMNLFFHDVKSHKVKSETMCKDLEPRSLIFVLAENHTEFFTSYISFFRKGLVQMLLNPKISTILLNELIATYMPNFIFLPNSRKNDLKSYKWYKQMGSLLRGKS